MWSWLIAIATVWWALGPIFFTILALAVSPWFWLLFLTVPLAMYLEAWGWSKWS